MRKKTDLLVIHCSATPANRDIGRTTLRQWHLERGFSDIGYHYVIRRDGSLETGRPEGEIGAHVQGYNATSIGICMVGGVNDRLKPEDNFTQEQFYTLKKLLKDLTNKYKGVRIVGHRDLDNKKACPSFDVAKWLKGNDL